MTTATTSRTGQENRVSDELKTQILSTLSMAIEPVTNDEIILAMINDGIKVSPYMAKRGLFELARDGIIASRSETIAERGLRSKRGTVAPGVHNILYWANGPQVPARTLMEAMPGIKLRAGLSITKGGTAGKAARSKKKRPAKALQMQTGTLSNERPAKAPAVQTGNRIERLESRIVKLEKTIENLMKALS